MMHTKSLPDSAGEFDKWEDSKVPCHSCNELKVKYRIWESSCGGFEDLNFKCLGCGKEWWVDGPDS